MLVEVFNIISILFDAVGLAFVILAGGQLVYEFFELPKQKKTFSLSHKLHSKLREHFAHRVIIALDFFLVSDLIRLAFAHGRDALVEVLLIVVIRTILSYFLSKEAEFGRKMK